MRKRLFRATVLMVVPFFASLLIRLLHLTNKKVFHSPKSVGNEPIILACWHGELLMLPYIYFRYRKTLKAKVLISSHFDGLLISKTIEYFGLQTIAGSTNRNAAKVLIQGIRALKDGYDIGITPDGPKGPRHEVADGIVVMAKKTKAKIVLLNVKPTKYWQLNSWDKFIIPKPFGTLHYYSTSEIDVSEMDIQEAKLLIKEGLLKHEA
ncbi:lysophospholipid acyltransferase family protein [Candidatus Sulfurimonas baltica]|uniref:Lysophospholipid acyltransferase family protein n=1 Tax=Candidatus Sulfurimonas baltica TaxID=2740404 RepID=A0A7S7RNE6_9BACT|nr:lysophospholipid acyltransferase family protein [Candidatus Sulfurimonas baltica]QOY52451.1 lysophospholipid acyltransferase family protein [Candidatus Sulfurimonas baltica]